MSEQIQNAKIFQAFRNIQIVAGSDGENSNGSTKKSEKVEAKENSKRACNDDFLSAMIQMK